MNILIIDDDESILEVMKIILEDAGHHVFISDGLDELNPLLKKTSPQIIFLDMMLNGTSGKNIINYIKKNNKYQKIPVILVSACNDIAMMAKVSGADDYLAKPFDMKDLRRMATKYE